MSGSAAPPGDLLEARLELMTAEIRAARQAQERIEARLGEISDAMLVILRRLGSEGKAA